MENTDPDASLGSIFMRSICGFAARICHPYIEHESGASAFASRLNESAVSEMSASQILTLPSALERCATRTNH